MQVEHYQNLYSAQREIRTIRHNISDNLVAISALLTAGQIDEAIERITGIYSDAEKITYIVDTGHPPIDAVIQEKLIKSENSNIHIEYKIIFDTIVLVDQFDIAILIANALDNAIEGVLRSDNNNRQITLDIAGTSDYISILVENHASGPIFDDFRTSKAEKANHGFGLEYMRAIAKKYDGDIHPEYSKETQLFRLEILLRNTSV